MAEKFQYGPQNRILRLEGKSLRNKFFHGKHYDVFLKLRHQAKTFRPFDDFFSAGFQKCILRLQIENLRNNLFHGKHYDFFLELGHLANFFRFLTIFFQQVFKNAFYVSGGSFREEDIAKNFSIHLFWTLS